MQRLWGGLNEDFAYSEAEGSSGGIIHAETQVFFLITKGTLTGDFEVVLVKYLCP